MESASRQGGASTRQVQVSHAMLPHEAELPHCPRRCRPWIGAPSWLSPHLEANMRSVVGKFLTTSAWAGVECQRRLPRPGPQQALQVLSWIPLRRSGSGHIGLCSSTCTKSTPFGLRRMKVETSFSSRFCEVMKVGVAFGKGHSST